MVETMVNWGVTHVFGMVGHSNLGFAEAMRRQEEAGNLTYIGIRHEGAAAFAASAYGKLTGRPAACFAIAGPGSTNLLTGLYDAKLDRAPVLAISGQVPSKVLGRGRLPGPRPHRRLRPTRRRRRPPSVLDSDHAELTTLALKHAVVEREVAHLVLPDEVQVHPVAGRGRRRPRGPRGRPGHRPARPRPGRGRRPPGRGPPAGDRGRPRRPLRHGRGPGAGRHPRRPRAHHVQGQGPGLRPPPARVRRARPQRDARRQLDDERVRRARSCSGRRSRTTPASPTTSRPSRSTPTRWRWVASTPSPSAVLGRRRRHRPRPRRAGRAVGRPGRPAGRRGRAVGHLAGGEGAPPGRRPRDAASAPRPCSRR